jgi:ABC-type glycerol-3-phosphate transport system substrate-binding protein
MYPNDFGTSMVTNEDNKTVLTILAGQSTSDAGIEEMIDEAIAEKFPSVHLDWECVDWGDGFHSQIMGRFAAGDAPDIIVGKVQDVYAYSFGENLAPININGMDKIHEEALSAVTKDGVAYGLPYNALYQGVLYNKKIFEKLNLEKPATLEELNRIVKVLKENNITPFASHFLESWKAGNMTMQFFINDIFRDHPDWGTSFRDKKINFTDNDAIINCLEQNQYILDNSWDDSLTIDQYESDRRFAEGEAAMYLTGSWSLQSINQYENSNEYGIFPYPNGEGNAELIKETNITFMISNTTKKQALINDIFEELLSNKKLMQEILAYTQSYSIVDGLESGYTSSISTDVEWYEENNKVVDASIGNNQLIWEFQSELAEKILAWLQGEESIGDVLSYADKHRMESDN